MNLLCSIVGHNWSEPHFPATHTVMESCLRCPAMREIAIPEPHTHDWTCANKSGIKRCKTCPQTEQVKRRGPRKAKVVI